LLVLLDEADVRMLFSVLALLLVALVVMKLVATQLQAVKPPASAGPPAQRAADLVNQAMTRAAAQAAAQAASQ